MRKLVDGSAAFYYRYTAPTGDRVRLPIGTGLDLAEARAVAAELSRRYQAGDRDLRGVLDAEQREATRERTAAKRAAETADTEARATLGALLEAYVAQLRRDGKASARDVETTLARHVETPWPRLWATPAASITADDLLEVVARVVDAGKLREAGKLRSFIRAAFAAAIRARHDARALPALRSLKITANPARDLATIEGGSQAGERALSVAELRAYWSHIKKMPAPVGALLRFHLLTGGQRIAQLQRATTADLDPDSNTVRLRDPKGRRKAPRLHDVPLIPTAAEALLAMAPERLGLHVFTVTAGETGAGHSVMRDAVARVVEAMTEAEELTGGPFTVGDLRRTVETRLAAEGVPLEVRSHLQSHGLGGVQARHYDRHSYLDEKRAALETLQRIATGKAATVTPLRGRQKRAG